MALPTDQQPSQVGTYEKILTIANRIMHGGEITKEEAPQLETTPVVKDDSYIVVINKDQMGHGSEELGKRLIKAYLYALGEQEVLPKKIIFYNNGGI